MSLTLSDVEPALTCEPVVVYLTIQQLRRCMYVFNGIAHTREFVVLDCVLDLLDGHALSDEGSEEVLRELSQKVGNWNQCVGEEMKLRLSLLAVVPAMGIGVCLVAGAGARAS
eukprot:5773058-Amphidinium_carterae.1